MAKKRKKSKKLGQTGVKHVPSMEAANIPKQMCKRAVYLLDSTLEDIRRGRTTFQDFTSQYEMVEKLNIPVQCVMTGKKIKRMRSKSKTMDQIRCFCYPPIPVRRRK